MLHSWITLSILTGTFFGIQSILLKILSKYFEQTTILKYLFLIAGIFLLPFSLQASLPVNTKAFLFAFGISLVLNIFAYSLLLTAVAKYPISIVMPFVGLTPLFLTLTSYLILGETITRIKFIGILLIVLGAFVLQLPARPKGEKSLRRLLISGEKGIGYMILVAFIWSITASVEKIAVKSSSPEFYGAAIHLSLGIVFLFIGITKQNQIKQQVDSAARKAFKIKWILILLGVVSAALALCQLTAIKIAFVTYVITFKRAGVLISTLYGFFFLKEKNYFKALSGTILILLGSGILTLF